MSGPGVVGTVEPMSDVDDLYDLRDNLDGLRSRLDRAGVAADPGPLRAHDESGAVSVETDFPNPMSTKSAQLGCVLMNSTARRWYG